LSDFMEIDPDTGIKTDFKWNETDQEYTLLRSADVEPVLDFTKAKANELGMNRGDMKKGWWCYAKLPAIVIIQMRAKGINVYDKNDSARMFAEINSHYPHLKMTTGNVGGREKIIG
jgi:hypothetical protein